VIPRLKIIVRESVVGYEWDGSMAYQSASVITVDSGSAWCE
jgi:hypothetical protein